MILLEIAHCLNSQDLPDENSTNLFLTFLLSRAEFISRKQQKTIEDPCMWISRFFPVGRRFVTAGEAPTPPPTTWNSEYGGAKGENNGIVAILELIADDIKKDIAKATSEEEASVKAYACGLPHIHVDSRISGGCEQTVALHYVARFRSMLDA